MQEEILPGYTRVTDIVNIVNIVYRVTEGLGFAPPEILDKAAAKGTRVHDAIESHYKGIPTELPVAEQGYFDSFLKWDESMCFPMPILQEKRYYRDDLMVTGKVDAIFSFKGGLDLKIIDFKTSNDESPKTWPLQAAFYYYLMMPHLRVIDRVTFLKLDKKGKMPQVYEYKIGAEEWETCKSALQVYRWLKK